MDNPVSRAEVKEIESRLDAENERQNHRLNALEETVKQIHSLTVSVEKLALSVERMTKEQAGQNERLKAIENRDGELLRKIVGYALTAGAGFLAALLLRLAGIF